MQNIKEFFQPSSAALSSDSQQVQTSASDIQEKSWHDTDI